MNEEYIGIYGIADLLEVSRGTVQNLIKQHESTFPRIAIPNDQNGGRGHLWKRSEVEEWIDWYQSVGERPVQPYDSRVGLVTDFMKLAYNPRYGKI